MKQKGNLFIIGTPIGNLKDITFRALETIKSCDVIFCEDTRVSRKLLTRYGIRKKLISLHGDSAEQAFERVTSLLERGQTVGYLTDAGMPGVSDPGASLVQMCRQKGFGVIVIPGVSAITTALSYSPREAPAFIFLGYPGVKAGEIERKLKAMVNLPYPAVFFVPPHDLESLLEGIKATLGDREILLCRELTKKFEEVIFARTSEILEKVETLKRGETTLVIYPEEKVAEDSERFEIELEPALKNLLGAGFTRRDCARILSVLCPKLKSPLKRKIYNWSSRDNYSLP